MADDTAQGTKELRLALVCYGGVSLAIYMHGVTKELHKLATAAVELGESPQKNPFDQSQVEHVYWDVLKRLEEKQGVRTSVVIDIISGTSAGGINGIALAKALAHNLKQDELSRVWIESGDIKQLLHRRAAWLWTPWLRAPLQLVSRVLSYLNGPLFVVALVAFVVLMAALAIGTITGLVPQAVAGVIILGFIAVSTAVTAFSWVVYRAMPPLDGNRMFRLVYEALTKMDVSRPEVVQGPTLMPEGHSLDLFVNVTDMRGHRQHIPIYSPSWVTDREYRHVLKFRRDEDQDHFDPSCNPALSFAARATSSFPGAFPPINVANVATNLGDDWSGRESFERDFFRVYQ